MPTFINGKQKAVVAFIVTLLGSAATSLLTAVQALEPGAGLGDLDTAAWLTVIIAVLGSTGLTTGAVYAIANRGPIGEDFDGDYTAEPEDGGERSGDHTAVD